MSRIYLIFSLVITLLAFAWNAQAATTQTTITRVITTPAPAAKETVVVPTGFTKCYNTDAGWYTDSDGNQVWVAARQVCEYASSTEGVAWVQGYWFCNKYNDNSDCTNWVWKAGHWVKTQATIYY